MDNYDHVAEEEKNRIYTSLADTMLEGLEANVLTDEDSRTSAQFILEQLEVLTTRKELMDFLNKLSTLWPVYKSVYSDLQAEEAKAQDSAQLQQAQEQLKSIQ